MDVSVFEGSVLGAIWLGGFWEEEVEERRERSCVIRAAFRAASVWRMRCRRWVSWNLRRWRVMDSIVGASGGRVKLRP
jgi:hypothetical protein